MTNSATLCELAAGVLNTVSPFPCVFHVDVVHADPATANEFQGGAGVDEGLANLGGRAHQHPVDGVLVDEGFKSVGVDKVGVQRVPGRGQSCGA